MGGGAATTGELLTNRLSAAVILLQYYYKRYKSSWDAIGFTRKLGEKLEKSLRNTDLSKYSFIFEAIDKLIAARRVLQWTYALAYYFKAGGQKSLFEYQQGQKGRAKSGRRE